MLSVSRILAPALIIAGIAAGSSVAPAAAAAPPACVAPDIQASIAHVVPVDLPPLIALQSVDTSAVVQLDLDERGLPTNLAIVKSTGSPVLDAAARRSVLAQTYAPQRHDCMPVGGSYRMIVDFSNNG